MQPQAAPRATFNPYGALAFFYATPGCCWGYSHSTLRGLSVFFMQPQAAPRATFNPYGALAFFYATPGCTWGYSHSTPSGLFNPIFEAFDKHKISMKDIG